MLSSLSCFPRADRLAGRSTNVPTPPPEKTTATATTLMFCAVVRLKTAANGYVLKPRAIVCVSSTSALVTVNDNLMFFFVFVRKGLGPVYELKYAFLYGYNGTTFAIPGTSVGVHTGDLEHVTIRVDARRRMWVFCAENGYE